MKISKNMLHPLALGALTCLGALIALPSTSFAQQESVDGEYLRPSPLEEGGSVVRRKLLFRSTRFEVAPLVGFTLADPFNRNILAGANVSFHLTNSFGIGATFGYGVTSLSTDLRNNIDAVVPEEDRSEIAYSTTRFVANVEGSYVPLFGKLSLFNSVILNYDLHLLLGAGFVGRGAQPSFDTGATSAAIDTLSGGTAAGVVGVGGRFYLNDFISFNTQVRDYIYSSSQVSFGTVGEPELRNNLMLSVGASFFFPTAVKVSR